MVRPEESDTPTAGWGSYTIADGSLQRVRFTGGEVPFPVEVATRENGVLVKFCAPVDRALASDANRHFAQCWNYRGSAAYGSPEFSLKHPKVQGHDLLEIASTHLLPDDHTLFLYIPQLQPANQVHLNVDCAAGPAQEIFLTVHKLGAPFTAFPGYRAMPKDHVHAHCSTVPVASAALNPWAKGAPGLAIRIASANGMQFSTKELRAVVGERLSLTFTNPDVMPHNWALLAPESLERIGELANKLVGDPAAAERQYIPESPDVLAYTDVVMPSGEFTIHFTAPRKPGHYPYVCTFPGHWQIINGTMIVE